MFGTELVRGFAFWKQTERTEAAGREIEAALRAPVGLAEREGTFFGLENEPAGSGRAPRPGGYQGGVSVETLYRPPVGSTEEGSRLCLWGMRRRLRGAGGWELNA